VCWCQKQAVTLPARQPHEADPIAACMHKPWSACYLTDCSCRNVLLQWGTWRHDPHVALTAAKQCILPLLCFTVSVCVVPPAHTHTSSAVPSLLERHTCTPCPFPFQPLPFPCLCCSPCLPHDHHRRGHGHQSLPLVVLQSHPCPCQSHRCVEAATSARAPRGQSCSDPQSGSPQTSSACTALSAVPEQDDRVMLKQSKRTGADCGLQVVLGVEASIVTHL
jgi:hypothetical protein